jgi:transposase
MNKFFTMPAPYNYDLRTKAIEAVKRGKRKIEVCRMLNISRNTLDLWLKREQETGDCRAIVNFQQGNGQKITDWERFREFVEQHGDLTQGQMAQLWGENVTQQNISKALGKMGISRKKKHTAIKNETQSNVKNFKRD